MFQALCVQGRCGPLVFCHLSGHSVSTVLRIKVLKSRRGVKKATTHHRTKTSRGCEDNYTWECWRERGGKEVEVHCGEVHYTNTVGGEHLLPLDKLSVGADQRD